MRRSRRRLAILILGLLFTVLASSFLYMWGMAALEGKPRTFWQSLEWAAETLSTTGYGADSRWRHPAMVLLVVAVQFLGVFLVFLIFPIYLIPFLEERFETRLPQEADKNLDGARGDLPLRAGGRDAARGAGRRGGAHADPGAGRGGGPPAVRERRRWSSRSLSDGASGGGAAGQARAIIANGTDDENAAAHPVGPPARLPRRRSWRWSRSRSTASP